MTKHVKWVTLTPEERRLVDPSYFRGSSPISAGGSGLMKQHTCEVQLPDRTTCRVSYQRDNGQWHRFQFDAPVSQRLYVNERLPSSVEAIEAKAQELAVQAYHQAQQAEQKERQRSTPPPGRRSVVPASIPLLRAKTAQAQAGLYAVCVMFKSDNLMPLGRLHSNPEAAAQEWEREARQREECGSGQPLVVGICCRWQRRWIRAQFVVYPQSDPNAETGAFLPHPTPHPDPEEDEDEAEAEPEEEVAGRRQTDPPPGAASVCAPAEEAPETPAAATPPIAPTKPRSGRKRTQKAAEGEPPRP